MKMLIINAIVIISGIIGWTAQGAYSDKVSDLRLNIKNIENGNASLMGGGALSSGIKDYEEEMVSILSYELNPLTDVRKATVLLAERSEKVFDAYGVNGSVTTVKTANSVDDLAIDFNTPSLGASSIELKIKINSISMIDCIDAARSILKKASEFYIDRIEFNTGELILYGSIIGKKEQ